MVMGGRSRRNKPLVCNICHEERGRYAKVSVEAVSMMEAERDST